MLIQRCSMVKRFRQLVEQQLPSALAQLVSVVLPLSLLNNAVDELQSEHYGKHAYLGQRPVACAALFDFNADNAADLLLLELRNEAGEVDAVRLGHVVEHLLLYASQSGSARHTLVDDLLEAAAQLLLIDAAVLVEVLEGVAHESRLAAHFLHRVDLLRAVCALVLHDALQLLGESLVLALHAVERLLELEHDRLLVQELLLHERTLRRETA